jgi:WD40 repeat protein
LTIWPTTAGKHTPILRQQTGSSSCLAFSPDGRTLAIGSDEGDITLHELPAASHRMVLRGHSNAVRSLSFSRDGNFLVSAGQDSLIMLWDTKRATPIRALLEGASNPNHIVAFSPDGRTVAVGETGGKPTDVLILEVNDGTIRTRLIGHSDGVCALAFSPDSRSLATASADHSVKLWNLDDGTEKTTFTEDVGRVNSLSFSSDGAWLEFAGDGIALRSLESTLRKLPRLGFISLPSPERISFTTEESAKKPGAGVLEQPQLRAFPVTAHSTL